MSIPVDRTIDGSTTGSPGRARSGGLTVLVVGADPDFIDDVLAGVPDCRLMLLEPNPAAVAPAWLESDRVEVRPAEYRFGIAAFDAALDWHGETPFDAVVAGADTAVRAAEEIAAWFDLPRPGPLAATLCTDRFLLRTRAQRHGLTQGRFAAVRNADDVRRFLGDGPIVLKPRRSTASTGIVRVDPGDDVDAVWATAVRAQAHERIASTGADGAGYMVEDLVATDLAVSVESFVRDGVPGPMAIVERSMRRSGGGTPVAALLPADLPQRLAEQVLTSHRRLLELTQYGTGVATSDWIVNADGVHLVGAGARCPAGRVSRIMGLTSGVRLGVFLANALVARPPEFGSPDAAHAAARYVVGSELEAAARVRGALNALPWVREVSLDGDHERPMLSRGGTLAMVGHVLVVADTAADLRDRVGRVSAMIEAAARSM